jgi:hypothetical protein
MEICPNFADKKVVKNVFGQNGHSKHRSQAYCKILRRIPKSGNFCNGQSVEGKTQSHPTPGLPDGIFQT